MPQHMRQALMMCVLVGGCDLNAVESWPGCTPAPRRRACRAEYARDRRSHDVWSSSTAVLLCGDAAGGRLGGTAADLEVVHHAGLLPFDC